MRILIACYAFAPSIGGLERVGQLLAEELCRRGQKVQLVTATPAGDPAWDVAQPYRIWRRPSLWRRLSLLLAADLVHANGASLAVALPAVLLRRPLVITHHGYQLVSVDGLGWGDGGPTPLDPGASLAYYRSRLAPLAWLRQLLFLHLRRWVARRAGANVAITTWMARRQPLSRQLVIPNPVALPGAAPLPDPAAWRARPSELLFLGRLVQEKGLNVLLEALARLQQTANLEPSLLVVGDGPMRAPWQALARELGISARVQFLGSRSGSELVSTLLRARIGVVPSVWEEPMGIVALELLAAGLVPVVSERGGLAEIVGPAGLVFANGDARSLAGQLACLLLQPELAQGCLAQAPRRLAACAPATIVERYLQLYRRVLPSRHLSKPAPDDRSGERPAQCGPSR